MKIYDISQEVFGSKVYPGDPMPQKRTLVSIDNGDDYNLTFFSMCAHNGTHIDAPFHFINNGKTVDQIELYRTIGFAYVAECSGVLKADDIKRIVEEASKLNFGAEKRILIKGEVIVSEEAAEALAELGTYLVGSESQSVGPEDAPMAVHKILLGADIILLEGIRLKEVDEGVYFLNAAPISLAGSDGSPCRAVLIDLQV